MASPLERLKSTAPLTRNLALLSLCIFAACTSEKTVEIPAHLQGKQLNVHSAFPAKYKEGLLAVAAAVENPEEFMVEIEEERGPVYVFHLWHQSAFLPQNRGLMGNPGGKCRDVRFDPATRKIVAILFWQ